MYVVTVVLFLIPCILICVGWGRRALHQKPADAPTWRDRCISVSFVSGILGALIGMAADLFWLHGGGTVSYTHLDVYKRQGSEGAC